MLQGELLVMPTDTVYGLVACCSKLDAVKRLYLAKSRINKPGTIIAASPQQLIELGCDEQQIQQAAEFWPASLSLVVDCIPKDPALLQNAVDIAVRIPDDDALIALLEVTGPLMTTSANLPDMTPAENIEEAYAYFGDTVDMYVDAGNRKAAKPSTIIKITNGDITVLREGAVTINNKDIAV